MEEHAGGATGPDAPGSVYTIGHSNHTLETFIGLLQSHHIEVLIDTRSSPFSRYAPRFNRDSVKAAAGRDMGCLGVDVACVYICETMEGINEQRSFSK